MKKTNELLRRIEDGSETRNILSGFILFFTIALLVSIFTTEVLVNRLDKPIEQEAELKPIIHSGLIERLGKTSIIVNGKRFNDVCEADLELLEVGDYVLIEKSGFMGCSMKRVIYQYTP